MTADTPASLEPTSANPSKPLAGLRFSLVGPGRVGISMAHWLVASGAQAVNIAGRDKNTVGHNSQTARRSSQGDLARLLKARPCALTELESAGQDLLLITTPDHHLRDLAEKLSQRPQARVALHTAGCFDAEILAPLRARGSAIGSLHPLKAFSRPLVDPAAAHGTFFAWDGDAAAQVLAHRVVTSWQGEGRTLTGTDRVLYHLAASLAAGGVVTLLALATDLTERLSLPRQVLRGYFNLAENALRQASATDHPAEAITGPAARDDMVTLARHRAALGDVAPEALEFFDTLTAVTRRQVKALHQRTPSPLGEVPPPNRR